MLMPYNLILSPEPIFCMCIAIQITKHKQIKKRKKNRLSSCFRRKIRVEMASSKVVRNLKVLILISHGHTSSHPTRLKNPAYVICKLKTPE